MSFPVNYGRPEPTQGPRIPKTDVARNDEAVIGLTDKETSSFSFIKAINAQASPNDRGAQEAAGFELACSRAAEEATGRSAVGMMIPNEVLKRDFIAGVGGTGQYLVGVDNPGNGFIDVLRNRMMTEAMGAQLAPGLVGDVAIPSMTASHTAYWIEESGAPTESKPTMGQVLMTPKTIGAFNEISRKLLKQSAPSAEALVRNDIASVLSTGLDLAALYGTGANHQPTGVTNWPGIDTSVAGGPDGAAPTYADMVALESAVASQNADLGSLGYLTNSKVRGKLKQTTAVNVDYGSIPVWEAGSTPSMGMINGYRAGCTNQIPSNLEKGSSGAVCSGIIFGDWSSLIIGLWGTLDLLVDPYALGSSGAVRVIGFLDADIALRHGESFSYMADALTT